MRQCYLFRDEYSRLSRGYGVVEFESIEGAVHTVGFKGYVTVRGVQVVIGFANPQCVRWGARPGSES